MADFESRWKGEIQANYQKWKVAYLEFISIFLNFLYVSEHVNATASCCCPLCCCPLACAFVLRVAWSPPHAHWVIRFYQDNEHNPVMAHLDLHWFHCTGFLGWARDHLFIGRADVLRDLVACF